LRKHPSRITYGRALRPRTSQIYPVGLIEGTTDGKIAYGVAWAHPEGTVRTECTGRGAGPWLSCELLEDAALAGTEFADVDKLDDPGLVVLRRVPPRGFGAGRWWIERRDHRYVLELEHEGLVAQRPGLAV
jgi:hypothetical protein